jgi:hypothetical protein
MPNAAAGDISSFTQDVVTDHAGGNETVNIRVGGAIGLGDWVNGDSGNYPDTANYYVRIAKADIGL